MVKDKNYYKAAGYYQRHSNANTLRKIQMFLKGRGYYNDDLDGLFGTNTYEAIRKYQEDNGLTVDGMWGEDTNSVHRVLNAVDAPYRTDASGSSGAHAKKGQGVNTGEVYSPSAIKTDQDLYRAIRLLKEKYYANGGMAWFWGDSQDATAWREFLQKTSEGQQILNEFYDEYDARYTTDQTKPALSYRKMTRDQQNKTAERAVTASIDNHSWIPAAFLGGAGALYSPLGAIGGFLGGNFGGNFGETIGSDWSDPRKTHTRTNYDLMGTVGSAAMPQQNWGASQGRTIGSAIGAVLGGGAGNYAGKNFSFSKPTEAFGDYMYSRPAEIQRIRVAPGVRSAQTRLPNGRYGPNVGVRGGQFTSGFSTGWGDTYPSAAEALKANPGMSVSSEIITPRSYTLQGTANTWSGSNASGTGNSSSFDPHFFENLTNIKI